MAVQIIAYDEEQMMVTYQTYLVYKNEISAEYWIPGAFSNETASRVLEGTKKVVNDSNGTEYAAHRDDILLAGKRVQQKSRHQKMILPVLN